MEGQQIMWKPTSHVSLVMEKPSFSTKKKTKSVSKVRDFHFADKIFSWFLKVHGVALFLLLILIGVYLGISALPTLKTYGWNFLFTKDWDPIQEQYGALAFVFGTVVSSLLALAIATPLSLGVALFLNELAPRKVSRLVGFLIEMLAAIPSVVFGLWGVFVLCPWVRETLQPFLTKWLGFLPIFQGTSYGVGMLTAGMILAIMIIPTISSLSKEVFKAVPRAQREAALALGATRWEMMKLSVLKASRTGIFGAAILGLGRALGETMAVTMVIGNRPDISFSLFAPAQTMASVIANEYAEASSSIHLSALAEIGLVLFLVTFVINAFARLIIWRVQRRTSP
jgi:phosphate transport system permease protein